MDRTAAGATDPARGFSGRVLHPTPAVAAAAGLAAAFMWMAVLAGEAARTGLAGSLRSRPDRLLGWAGAAFWAPLTIATALAAVLVVVAALGLRVAIRGRATWLATVALLAAAGLGELAIQVFTPDANMYETNPLRGLGAWVLVLAAPAAAAFAGVGLVRAGSTVTGWASMAASLVMVWVAVDLAAVGATSGAVQPQTEASVGVEVVLAAWLVAMSILMIAIRGRASVTGIASRRGKLAMGGVGAVTTVLFGAQMIAAVVGYSYLGPTVLAQIAGRTQAATIEVDGVTRSYRIHRAPSLDPKPGLVISLSGVFGDGFQSEFNSGFDDEVDRAGWIAIYPDSVLDGWMAYGNDDTWGHHPGADDVPFLRALIEREIAGDGVDPGRVFVSGMSRGGMMTHRAGCELADVVAAIAPVSGNMATTS